MLNALATTFAADSLLRGFLTQVFSSKHYQLSSAYADENSDPLLPRRVLRRHNAETSTPQWLRSLALGSPAET